MSQTTGTITQGTITTNGDAVAVAVLNAGNVAVQLTGTWTGTVDFKATVDGSTWFSVNAIIPTSATEVTSATANGQWIVPVAGYSKFRVVASAPMTGTLTVSMGVSVAVQTTILTADNITASENLAQVGGNTVLAGNGVTGTGSQRVTIASDNTPFPVKTDQTTHGTTDLVAADITKVAGTALVTGNGVTSAGSPRVTVASDNTPFPVKTDQTTHGTTDLVAADITKIAGNAAVAGNGVTGTGSLRVTVASDNTPFPVKTDQTTPGTTDHVSPISGQNGVAGGAGATGATTQRVVLATDTTVPNVTGNVAAAATDSGNPVKVGGKYNASAPTLTDGQRGDLQLDSASNAIANTMQLDPSNDGVGAARVNSQAIAPTTSGAGYVSGDVVGGIISITTVNYASGRRVSLKTLCIRSKDGNSPALHIYFFKATPSAGTYTDSAALAWGTGDAANLVGSMNVQAGDWLTDNSQSFVTYSGLDMKMPVNATTLFMLIVAQGTYTLTNGSFTMNAEFNAE